MLDSGATVIPKAPHSSEPQFSIGLEYFETVASYAASKHVKIYVTNKGLLQH